MTCKGKVVGGVVVLDDPQALPEGAQVKVAMLKSQKRPRTATSEPWSTLLKFAGKAKGLPADMARNHDHYIHGTPKR
jgi:hypothetical protein